MLYNRDNKALAAVGTPPELHAQNIVILCIAISSAIGALWIVFGYAIFKQARTFRHQLILGLAISDLLMALNFISSTAAELSGHSIGSDPMRNFCLANGFLVQWFVIQTDYWVLSIAVCTYFLVMDHRTASKWVQQHRILVFAIPPVVSCIWAAIGLGLRAYDNIGAWCWFPSDRTRLLVNFVPRWVIILSILVVYARLFALLYTTHRRSSIHFLNEHYLDKPENSGSWRSGSVSTDRAMLSTSEKWPTRQSTRTSSGASMPPTLKKIAYQMMTYPLIYMLIWSIPTAIRIYQSTTGKPAPTALATVDKGCIVVQGLCDALIYGYNECSMSAWRGVLTKFKNKITSHTEVGDVV
ncbi:hypothetical protein BT63DRAFT_218957 [Microthyrium microscopicum]|uniref:G-protein coupled receptors family 2 profile 2 domain-containing protein n=1 Tax=Microthyrium microscopicum TaxID=703497 RepID=A0A6A6UGU9_9PEZI|nr:hypothetical protein BT63DRAFT_218957 [Microthyrium microscopicum]